MDLAPLAVVGIVALWGLLGFFAWTAATVLGRRPDMLVALPLCVIAGIAGGALVPALGRKDGLGLGLSLLAALLASAVAAAVFLRLSKRSG